MWLEERNEKAISREALSARLEKIIAEPPKEKIERYVVADLQGKKIKERFWCEGDVSCAGGRMPFFARCRKKGTICTESGRSMSAIAA